MAICPLDKLTSILQKSMEKTVNLPQLIKGKSLRFFMMPWYPFARSLCNNFTISNILYNNAICSFFSISAMFEHLRSTLHWVHVHPLAHRLIQSFSYALHKQYAAPFLWNQAQRSTLGTRQHSNSHQLLAIWIRSSEFWVKDGNSSKQNNFIASLNENYPI